MTSHDWRRRNQCSVCGADNDTLSNVDGDKAPRPGDAAICLYCGYVSIVAEGGKKLRKPTPAEQVLIAFDPKFQLVLRAHRDFKKRRSN